MVARRIRAFCSGFLCPLLSNRAVLGHFANAHTSATRAQRPETSHPFLGWPPLVSLCLVAGALSIKESELQSNASKKECLPSPDE